MLYRTILSHGRLVKVTRPGQKQTNCNYDKIYNPTQIVTGNETLTYQHDKTGLITHKVHNSNPTDYRYDEITRLIQAGTQSYHYDAAGNNLDNGAKYDAKTHRLTENNSDNFSYDASGNLIQKKKKDNSQSKNYSYNARNQLTKVETLDSANQIVKTLAFAYDALGRRYSKTQNGQIKRYVYDGDNIIAILDGTGATSATLLQGDKIDTPLAITSGGNSYYYHRDHQGSILSLTDSNGATVESNRYDAYGVTTKTSTVNTGNIYGYTGREYDDEDLYYYRARYYDPTLQRFISEDPIYLSSGDYNFYAYVGGNPVNGVDPFGLQWQFTVGVSLDFGGSPVLIASPFVGGGVNVGFTSSGQFFIQATGSGSIGVGAYGGVGTEAGASYSECDLPSGLSTSKAAILKGNFGAGPSVLTPPKTRSYLPQAIST